MSRLILRLAVLVLSAVGLGLAAPGCASQPDARYVYQDGQFGVVGVPRNTRFGTKDYLQQAHELMARHFPEGYEIVRAEEVVEGSRVLDTGKKTEIETDPSLNALNQMIKLGKLVETRSLQQKDTLPILESRIIYKRRRPGEPPGANGFSALASTIPEFYIDPNEMTRCKALTLMADAKKTPGARKGDDGDVRKVASEPPK